LFQPVHPELMTSEQAMRNRVIGVVPLKWTGLEYRIKRLKGTAFRR